MLVRAGYIRQLAAGLYSYLPLAHRSLRKIEQILREEMDAIGGQEMCMPVVHPAELWQQSGRWYDIGPEMGRLTDRRGRDLVLAMTHEEVVTDLCKSEIRSYRQLPQMVYHMQTKFRDEPRARGGLIRVIMPRNSSTSRKIKKRKTKNNKDTNLYTKNSRECNSKKSNSYYCASIDLAPFKKNLKTEKNKKKKIKYKLKKKQRKIYSNQKRNPVPKPGPSFASSTRRWKWKTLKSTSFSLKQKKLLFKVHHLSTIIERNKVIIYNLQSNLTTTSLKTNTGNLTFTTQSSTQRTPANILQDIKYLESENKTLTNRIQQIKEKEQSDQLKKKHITLKESTKAMATSYVNAFTT